jgi:hypothetical protein
VVVAFAFLTATAKATPIPIEITGEISHTRYNFNMTGPGFEYSVSTNEGPYAVGICGTTPCDISQTYSAGEPSVRFGERVALIGQLAPEAGGLIRILFPLLEGAAAGEGLFSTTVPMALLAEITAYTGTQSAGDRGQPLFTVVVHGSGEGTALGRTFTDGETVVQGLNFTITGTAEEVPEPATVVLVVVGLGALALLRCRHRLRASA